MSDSQFKLAVFLPNWVGDVVMATPTLRALRKHYGRDCQMIGVMRPYVADVLEGTPWLDESLFYDPKSKIPDLGSWNLIRELRKRRVDMAVLLTNSLRTGFLAWAGAARERIGYVRSGRGVFLSRKLYPPRIGRKFKPTPALDYYLELAYALGCPPESPAMELATSIQDEAAADTAWGRLGLPPGDRVVAINSSGAYGAAKLWPSEYFSTLARRIAKELDYSVLVLCGPNERTIAREIVHGAAHPRVVSLAELPSSIGLSKACVRRSRLMVTTDSGPRHFAAAFGTPVITLFGPTHIEWSETHFPLAVHLQHKVDCGPCQRPVCPEGHHRCMRDLTVDRVFRAVAENLAAAKVRAA